MAEGYMEDMYRAPPALAGWLYEEDDDDDQELLRTVIVCRCCEEVLDEVVQRIEEPKQREQTYNYYCQSCWKDLPMQVVTVVVDQEQRNISCVGMDGSRLAEATQWEYCSGTIGDLRRRVLEKVRGFTSCDDVTCDDSPSYIRCKASEQAIVSLALPDGRILSKGESDSPLSKLFNASSIFTGDIVTYHGQDQKLAGKMLIAGTKGEVIATEDLRCNVRFPGLSSFLCSLSNLEYCGEQSFDSVSLRQQPMLLPRPCTQTPAYHTCLHERSDLANLNLEPARISLRAYRYGM